MTTNIETSPKNNYEIALNQLHENIGSELTQKALVTIDRDMFSQEINSVVRKNSALLNTHQGSLITAFVNSATIGLRCTLGDCYIIPFYNKQTKRKEAQLIIGYQGMRKLAKRAGYNVFADSVHENDVFNYVSGTEPSIKHELNPFLKSRGKVIGFYAYATDSLSGERIFAPPMSTIEMIEHKNKYAKSPNRGPWVDEFESMGIKTMVRRVCTLLPKENILGSVANSANVAFEGEKSFTEAEAEVITPSQRPDSIDHRLEKESENVEQEYSGETPVDDYAY